MCCKVVDGVVQCLPAVTQEVSVNCQVECMRCCWCCGEVHVVDLRIVWLCAVVGVAGWIGSCGPAFTARQRHPVRD